SRTASRLGISHARVPKRVRYKPASPLGSRHDFDRTVLPQAAANTPKVRLVRRKVMKKFFQMGGVVAGAFLVLFGIGAIVIGLAGRAEVRDNVAREAIVGTPDMTPSAIKSEAAKAGLKNVDLPTCNVAGHKIDTGDEAKCFASYMRIHTLES